MKKNLNVYISYSLNNTNQSTLQRIKSALIKKGYNVTHYINGETYTTPKLDNADIVLFVGYPDREISDTEVREFLSRGQYTELERSLSKGKKILFYAEFNECDEFLIYHYNHAIINDPNDWKKYYAHVYLKTNNDGYCPDIDFMVESYNKLSINNNILLLL